MPYVPAWLLLAAVFYCFTKVAVVTSVVGVTTKAGPAHNWLVKLSAAEHGEILQKCSDGEDSLKMTPVVSPSPPLRHVRNITSFQATNASDYEQRIFDGQLATPGLFLSSTVLTYPIEGHAHHLMCGASLISPRHLLTAAHCISGAPIGDVYPAIKLLAGGVCTDAASSEACPSRDMDELDIELVIREYFLYTGRDGRTYGRRTYDLAIIQLAKPLSSYLPEERAEFACLPDSNDAEDLPMYINAWGWGMRGSSRKGNPSIHLRYVSAITRPLPNWRGEYLLSEKCSLPATPTFCLFSPSGAFAVTRPGDSGSGVVSYRRGALTNVLYGVQTSDFDAYYSLTPAGEEKHRLISVVEATAHYLDDLCHYLGVCQSHSNGLKTRLALGSVLLTQPRSSLPPIAPFRFVSSAEEAKIDEYCAQLTERPYPIPSLTWAVGLVEQLPDKQDPERVLCTATLISTAHLVASRRCIVDYLRSRQKDGAGAVSRLRLIASEHEFCYRPRGEGSSCAAVREGRTKVFVLRPEFIAWHRVSAGRHNSTDVFVRSTIDRGIVYNVGNYRPPYTIHSDLAIIQLVAEDAEKLAASEAIKPACLEKELNPGGYSYNGDRRIGALAFGVSMDVGVDKGIAWPRGRLGNQSDGMPSDVLLVDRDSEREAKYASAWERGAGLLDSRNHRLLGLLLERGRDQRFYYMHLWEYADVFCTFLNLGCRPNSAGVTYLDNRIPSFDRFLYMG